MTLGNHLGIMQMTLAGVAVRATDSPAVADVGLAVTVPPAAVFTVTSQAVLVLISVTVRSRPA